MSRPEDRLHTSYLLRIWCSGGTGAPYWRASLQDLTTGTQLGFTSVEALCAHLDAARWHSVEPSLGTPAAAPVHADGEP